MAISRITFNDYLALSDDQETTDDHPEAGHAWFASSDRCLLGRVVLHPVSYLWEPVVSVAIAGGWVDVHVEPDAFTTLRSAERSLVDHMSGMTWPGNDCGAAVVTGVS